ncbi:AraC family ligand binding domain-containing protein [Paenibacillus sp. P26]|nr:AraC family ligand binding domain-containing protein [Paenibacillus sp. P26]
MSIQRTVRSLRGDEFALGDLPIFVNRSVESYELSEHRHDFLEISYVSEGTGTHYTGKASLSTGQGDIFLIPVGVSHVFRPASTAKNRPLVVYNCIITMEAAPGRWRRSPEGQSSSRCSNAPKSAASATAMESFTVCFSGCTTIMPRAGRAAKPPCIPG